MIYLDNAATTLHKPKEVQEAVIAAFGQMGNSGRGASEPALKALGTVYDAREALARLFHAENASEIVFTANSTEALNIAIKGILDPGDHVITTAMEHNSVLRPLYLKEQQGVALTILPVGEDGTISSEAFEEAIRPDTEAIVCTHASNVTGTALNLYRIGEACKRHGLHFIVDASQSAGILPIDIQAMILAVRNIDDEADEEIRELLNKLNLNEENKAVFLDKEIHMLISRYSKNKLIEIMNESLSNTFDKFIFMARKTVIENEEDILTAIHKDMLQSLLERNDGRGVLAINKHYDVIDKYI